MATGRILTLLASSARVVLGGLLVRHRGLLAVIVTSGLLAVYPASVTDSHTIFIEPWVTLSAWRGPWRCLTVTGWRAAPGWFGAA